MKNKIIRLFIVFIVMFTAMFVSQYTIVIAESNDIIYVSSSGSDNNSGTVDLKLKTLDKALTIVENGGTIYLDGAIPVNSWNSHNKSATIIGGTIDFSAITEDTIEINDDVTFKSVTFKANSSISELFVFANGYKVTIGENCSWVNANRLQIYGGGKAGTTVASTNLTVLSGTYLVIAGGSRKGVVLGDTKLYVGGTVNSNIDVTDHAGEHFIYGGGCGDTINGSTNVEFSDNAKVVYLFGGSTYSNGNAIIKKGSNIKITGGQGMSIYAGNRNCDVGSGAKCQYDNGTFEQVFGGNERASLTGDVDLRINGGKITRRVYGGCYNDTTGIFNISFVSQHHVCGKIALSIGDDANIVFSSSDPDRSIFARSRYNQDLESTSLIFTGVTAYNNYKNKLGASDSIMQGVMNGVSASDEYHCYTYEKSGNEITQKCLYHTSFNATAILSYIDNKVENYTGNKIEPVSIIYSANWEYDKPQVEYTNNIEVGVATWTVNIGGISQNGSFKIMILPEILGASVRLSEPTGIRFASKVSESLVEQGAIFGTLVIPRYVLGDNELTIDVAKVKNIPQTKWANEYEEGYRFYYAVLAEIPSTDYDTVLVARSYVLLDGVYYYSEQIERSIAQVSAYALRDNYTDTVLYNFVDIAISNETQTMENEVVLTCGYTYKLNLTGIKDYVAIWKSNNSDIVSVNEDGTIMANQSGETVISAQIGSKILYCKIIVRSDSIDKSNELPFIIYD